MSDSLDLEAATPYVPPADTFMQQMYLPGILTNIDTNLTPSHEPVIPISNPSYLYIGTIISIIVALLIIALIFYLNYIL